MTISDTQLAGLATRLGARLSARGWRVATAESCSGGWVAKAMTDIAGSSSWFECGFVTYSNAAKQTQLGVPAAVLEADGAVSAATVEAMARGALMHSQADLACAISGIAGPGGGSADKPVGLVWFAWATRAGQLHSISHQFPGDREAVRRQAVAQALQGLYDAAG